VRLALAAMEQSAGLVGELGLVAGSAVHGQAAFEVSVDQFVGVSSGEYAGRKYSST
jgi:hypothetical protein